MNEKRDQSEVLGTKEFGSRQSNGSGALHRSTGASGSSRRQAYISVNHLLNFEVTSSPRGLGGLSSSPPRRSHRPGTKHSGSFTKERFIHANFRFVALDDTVIDKARFTTNPDAPLEWNDIELVIVPAQHDVICPICLDTPLTPRLTKCGHFFCWPCILQYAAANTVAGSGNWRKCPICFESINVKQLKSAFFSQVKDYTSNTNVSEVGIPMTLLRSQLSSCKVIPFNFIDPDSRPRTLSDLSPFDRISFVSRSFVRENVIRIETQELEAHLITMNYDDYDRVFIELALTMVDDRRQVLESETEATFPSSSVRESVVSNSPIFFHQSSDGQPFFLCPLSIKMLKKHFGSYDAVPTTLSAPVVEIEMAIMTEELRRRYKYLHHLPIGCQFGLCEVDLAGIVSTDVLEEFAPELQARFKNRKYKAHREEKLAAEAHCKALQKQYQYLENYFSDSRTISPAVPGVVMGIFMNDYENFPLPPGSEEVQPANTTSMVEPRSVPTTISTASAKPLAGSFASVAATSPQNDPFLIIPSSTSNSNTFDTSFDDLPIPPSNSSEAASKKGKRIVLVSNIHRRLS